MNDSMPPLAVVVKGWPRLSETFIAQELVALEEAGHSFEIWSLRHPTDKKTHPLHDRLRAICRSICAMIKPGFGRPGEPRESCRGMARLTRFGARI